MWILEFSILIFVSCSAACRSEISLIVLNISFLDHYKVFWCSGSSITSYLYVCLVCLRVLQLSLGFYMDFLSEYVDLMVCSFGQYLLMIHLVKHNWHEHFGNTQHCISLVLNVPNLPPKHCCIKCINCKKLPSFRYSIYCIWYSDLLSWL